MIVVSSVSKSYGGVRALDKFSLQVNTSEVVAIAGPSGSGKTTLLRLIAGLEQPDAGEIQLDGVLTSLPPHERSIGFAFQQPALWPHMTVGENVGFPISHWAKHDRQARVVELLEAVELPGSGERRPAELSGGEARRVALARALAAKPKRLLLDEPLVNLDEDLRTRLLAHILRAAEKTGATLLFVTHDLREATTIPGRLIRMPEPAR